MYVVQTLGNTREADVTMVAAGDEEIALDEADDEFAGVVFWGCGWGPLCRGDGWCRLKAGHVPLHVIATCATGWCVPQLNQVCT